MDKMKQGEMLADIVSAPYVWPGGYDKFLVMQDGGCLCKDCAHSQEENIKEAIVDGWPGGPAAGPGISPNSIKIKRL